ncbi:hypothetical protein DYB37_011544 [Aphanomyces astaci]|uniref:Uncharacterized protein n=1 Tax=Aphanomyces astaci TaxID=112090 RepID=A0A418FLB8_APHAT|nr:hypothetical protein DYB37_011544 [Aphanomyces astaci]
MPPPRNVYGPPTTTPSRTPGFESGDLTGCNDGETSVDVEGAEGGRFCVDSAFHCSRELPQGPCPPPQDGLPFGSYCTVTVTGLLKCQAKINGQVVVPLTYTPDLVPKSVVAGPPTTTTSSKSFEDGQLNACDDGLNPIVVLIDGAAETFCIDALYACSNALPDGPCPPPQSGLPNGSTCTQITPQSFGCVERV